MRSRSNHLASAVFVLLGVSFVAPSAHAQDTAADSDALDPLRERFRAGLEKFRAGAFAEAILIWETIYRELGPEKGYRLAFNLARAYEQFGDSTRAAESYDAYVTAVARRREANEQLEPNVEKQEAEAKERLDELGKALGRIRFVPGPPTVVRIDSGSERVGPSSGWVAYVTPGKTHVVTFDPGTTKERHVDVSVGLGDVVELTPPTHEEVPPPPRPVVTLAPTEAREERPFSPTVLYVAAGVTALSVVLPIALYAHASGVKDDYDATAAEAEASRIKGDASAYGTAQSRGRTLSGDYDDARSNAQLSLAVPIVLGAATAGLTAWWLFGSKAPRASALLIPTSNGVFAGGGARF